jgi:putative ABC transport system permease protein
MDMYLAAIQVSLAYALMSLGIFVTLRIFKLPDITTDGTFTSGAVVYALMMQNADQHLLPVLFFAFFAGGLGGFLTGIINEKLKIQPLLSGILVMTALYSINLLLLGKSNMSLPLSPDADSFFESWFIYLLVLMICLGSISWLLYSDYGLAMRATGHAEQMVKSQGIFPGRMRIAGLMIANGLTALSGAMVARFHGFADMGMGIGIVIAGLGSVMISETLLQAFGVRSLLIRLCMLLPATMLFRFILAFSLSLGVDPVLLKLISSLLVLGIIAIPILFRKSSHHA